LGRFSRRLGQKIQTTAAGGDRYMGKRLAIVIGVAAAAVMALGPSAAGAAFPGKNGPIAFTALHDLGGQCRAAIRRRPPPTRGSSP
jgi:hypothetical protein